MNTWKGVKKDIFSNRLFNHEMKLKLFFLLVLLSGQVSFGQLSPLKISENQRFLVKSDGSPFFWMGDTAWELFHRNDREEADYYLKKRAEQGFNVIQAVVMAEMDGLNTPNAYLEKPLISISPMVFNEKYFQHVDYIISKAEQYGIYVALLPTWADKLFKDRWGAGPEIFNQTNAFQYGKWIGNRYRDRQNIIWVLGGDRTPRKNTDDVEVWRKMAAGIQEGVGGKDKALMTLHPQPASPGGSSNWFHQDEWLDFNMHQTGHCPNEPTYKKISHDYSLTPVKPTLDGEPLYEDHPNCFNAKEFGYSVPEDIRRIMYWNVFAGAFGQTYGCHDIWQMYKTGREPVNGPLRPWKVALDLPMANQVKHLKNLMLSRPFLSRVPDQGMVITPQEDDQHYIIATRDAGGSYAMVFFPTGKTAELDLSALKGKTLNANWFDPRTGATFAGGSFDENNRRISVSPPSAGKGQDWVLVIDDAAREFSKPGQIR